MVADIQKKPLVSIVIPTMGVGTLLQDCINSLKKNTTYKNYEIIIVDDSGDSQKQLKVPGAKILKNKQNSGFSYTVNQGIHISKGDFIFISNDDFIYQDGEWLSKLVDVALKNPKIGVVGPKFIYLNGEVQWPSEAKKDQKATSLIDVKCVIGLTRKKIFEKIGYFDEGFSTGYLEDDDISHRIKLIGYKVMCNQNAAIIHLDGATIKSTKRKSYIEYLYKKNVMRYNFLNSKITKNITYLLFYFSKSFFALFIRRKDNTKKHGIKNIRINPLLFRDVFYHFKGFFENLVSLPHIFNLRLKRQGRLIPSRFIKKGKRNKMVILKKVFD